MGKVLVVDDEKGYCDHLALCLSAEGFEVATAGSGSEAIGLGSQFRPDVLVADWMLKNHLHGLHVSEALQVVVPQMQTILITGFGSPDLKSDAAEMNVFDFLEKPFDVDRISRVVRAALDSKDVRQAELPIGVVVTNDEGQIIHANSHARALFGETLAGSGATSLGALIESESLAELPVSESRWVELCPRGHKPVIWHVRCRQWPESSERLYVILNEEQQSLRSQAPLRRILGLDETDCLHCPFLGHVLIIDDEEMARRAIAARLEHAGCVCHAAESGESAIQMLERDPEITTVIMDHDLPATNAGDLIKRLRAVYPAVRIVGTSALDHRDDFREAGVSLFLAKPWRLEDLVSLLTNRIGACIHCGLPIPLRRPSTEDEPVRSWICRGCGCRYSAVLDDDCPPDTHKNVVPAE